MFKPLQVINQKASPRGIHEDYEESLQITPHSQEFEGWEGNNSFGRIPLKGVVMLVV